MLQRLFLKVFTKLPAGLTAEPFEILLITIGSLDAVRLLLQHFQHLDESTFLPYYHGVIGLFIWTGVMLAASVVLIWALATLDNHNLLEVRKFEITGLWLYAVAFGWYGYTNLSVGLSAGGPVVYPILSEVIIIVIVLACVVRAITLASPITALSVSRVNRVRQIQGQLKSTLDETSQTLQEASKTLQKASDTLQEASDTTPGD
jgi:hypothetical protein